MYIIFTVLICNLCLTDISGNNVTDRNLVELQTTDVDDTNSNVHVDDTRSQTEKLGTNPTKRAMRDIISTEDDNSGNNEQQSTTTTTMQNISNTTKKDEQPHSAQTKFDIMAAVLSNFITNTKKNFKPNQCKGVYEPVLISAGLMKPNMASETYVIKGKSEEPPLNTGTKSSDDSNKSINRINSTNREINTQFGNDKMNPYYDYIAPASEADSEVDYYGYDDYYYQELRKLPNNIQYYPFAV